MQSQDSFNDRLLKETYMFHLILNNKEFFDLYMTCVDFDTQNMLFTRAETKYLAACLIEFRKKNTELSRDVFADYVLSKLTVDSDFQPIVDTLRYKLDAKTYKYYFSEFKTWLKNQAYIGIYSENLITAVEQGDYDVINKYMSDVINKVDRISISEKNFDPFEESESIPFIDAPYDGLRPIHAYVGSAFIGITGQGKTTQLANVAARYIQKGLNVMWIGFEEHKSHIQRKLLGCLLSDKLRDKYQRWEDIDIKYAKQLWDKELQANPHYGLLGVAMYSFVEDGIDPSPEWVIDKVLQWEKQTSKKCNIVVVDYADHLDSDDLNDKYKFDKYKASEILILKMVHYAQEYKFHFWTAMQTQRSAVKDGASLDNLRGAFNRTYQLSYIYTVNKEEIGGKQYTVIEPKKDRASGSTDNKIYLKWDGLFKMSVVDDDAIYAEEVAAENNQLKEAILFIADNKIVKDKVGTFILASELTEKYGKNESRELINSLFHCNVLKSQKAAVVRLDGASKRAYEIDTIWLDKKHKEVVGA